MRRPAQTCQVPGCNADLTNLRSYFVRQHICEEHARADAVPDGRGGWMRFCQQCTKLEPVSAFEGLKRSCEASLQKRHLRRSGGGAAAAARSRSTGSGYAAGGYAGRGAATLAMPPLPPVPAPLPMTGAAGAAAAAAIAAALAGAGVKAEDRSSPCSTGSLQPAATTRSSSEGRGMRPGSGMGPANPLAALLEAAGLPDMDMDHAGPISLAELPPLASNTKQDGTGYPPFSFQLGGLANGMAGLPTQLGAPQPHAHTHGIGSWQAPNNTSWGGGQANGLAQLLASAAAAAGSSPSTADTHTLLLNNLSGGSSKATVDQALTAQTTLGSGAQHEGAQQAQQPVDMQQMLSALQVLQQLQEAISTLVVAHVQQQQAPPQPTAQQQLLALLTGAPAAPPPQQPAGDTQAMLQLLSQLTQQQQAQHGAAAVPALAPAVPVAPQAVAPVRSTAASPAGGLDAQLLQAVTAGGGAANQDEIKALISRLTAGMQQ